VAQQKHNLDDVKVLLEGLEKEVKKSRKVENRKKAINIFSKHVSRQSFFLRKIKRSVGSFKRVIFKSDNSLIVTKSWQIETK
jgi:hypothetical protein